MKISSICLIVLSFALVLTCATGLLAQPATAENNAMPPGPLSGDRMIDPDKYLMRAGEQLDVVFPGTKLPNLLLSVNGEGRIIDRNLGQFEVDGRTLTQVRELLFAPLKKLYQSDDILISARGLSQVAIQVTGWVARPGRYTAHPLQTVADIIEKAGGVSIDGSRRSIEFLGGPETIIVDLVRAEFSANAQLNPSLYSGLSLFVPMRSPNRVRVSGAVHSPGVFELLPGDNLATILELARSVRSDGDGDAAYVLGSSEWKPGSSAEIHHGDIIVVPELATPETQGVTLVGAVSSPGLRPFTGAMSLADLLAASGGLLPIANGDRATVFRRNEQDALGNRILGRYPLQTGNGDHSSIQLAAGDSVYVPVTLGYVMVDGDILRSGHYPFRSGKSAAFYIDAAGGVLDDAKNPTVFIFDRVSGLTRETGLEGRVVDGDRVVVRLPQETE